MASGKSNQIETYRAIVLNRSGTEVFLVTEGDRFYFPSVGIPAWERVTECVNEALRIKWGEEAISLLTLPAASVPSSTQEIRYQVLEHWRVSGEHQTSARWTPMSALCADSFVDPSDCRAVRQSVAECVTDAREPLAGSFGRLGCFQKLRKWVEAEIEPRGLHLHEKFRQLSASPCFSLIRFETDGGAVWFKAVGPPNQREFPITCALAQLFPSFLPPILAVHHGWNGWLAEEVEGTHLSDSQDVGAWKRVAEALAKLQIASMDHGAPILAAGAHDLRVGALLDLIQPFIEAMAGLMEQQSRVPPTVLAQEELQKLGMRIQDALYALADLGVPDALGHLDLNPGNLISPPNQCVFLDWAEAYVGDPFLSFQYLLEHFRRRLGHNSTAEAKLINTYVEQWEHVLSRSVVDESLALAPLLAVFAYAAGNKAWADEERLEDPNTAAYLRSLTRRMNREATLLNERRPSSCLD